MIIFTIIGIVIVAFIVIDWVIKVSGVEKSNSKIIIKDNSQELRVKEINIIQDRDTLSPILEVIESYNNFENKKKIFTHYESIIDDVAFRMLEVDDVQDFNELRSFYNESYQEEKTEQLDIDYFEAKILSVVIFIYWYRKLFKRNTSISQIFSSNPIKELIWYCFSGYLQENVSRELDEFCKRELHYSSSKKLVDLSFQYISHRMKHYGDRVEIIIASDDVFNMENSNEVGIISRIHNNPFEKIWQLPNAPKLTGIGIVSAIELCKTKLNNRQFLLSDV